MFGSAPPLEDSVSMAPLSPPAPDTVGAEDPEVQETPTMEVFAAPMPKRVKVEMDCRTLLQTSLQKGH